MTTERARVGTAGFRLALVAVLMIWARDAGADGERTPKIFDRSWSGSQTGGRGLGLAIARQIAEAHGGTLAAQSPDADGATTFVLTVHH